VDGSALFVPSSNMKETQVLDQTMALNFAHAVKAMSQAVFLIWFGVVWIFTLLFIGVLDRQIFMILLKETWPITLMVPLMMFSGYNIGKRIFELYPINPFSIPKSRRSKITIRNRNIEKVPLKL